MPSGRSNCDHDVIDRHRTSMSNMALRKTYWFEADSPKAKSYRCHFCGCKTSMKPYMTDYGKGKTRKWVYYPSCCIKDECIAIWDKWTVKIALEGLKKTPPKE